MSAVFLLQIDKHLTNLDIEIKCSKHESKFKFVRIYFHLIWKYKLIMAVESNLIIGFYSLFHKTRKYNKKVIFFLKEIRNNVKKRYIFSQMIKNIIIS